MNDRELRYNKIEFRASEDGKELSIFGYAAVFNSLSEDLGCFREIIMPGAFTNVLAQNPDVRLLINHEGCPLARTASGTLTLTQDEKGLRFDAKLDPTDPDVQKIIPKMKRGDLTNCSFAFCVLTDNWRIHPDGYDLREVQIVDKIYDVSIVTYPAYTAADCSLRSHKEWKEKQTTPLPNFDIMKRHLDLLRV